MSYVQDSCEQRQSRSLAILDWRQNSTSVTYGIYFKSVHKSDVRMFENLADRSKTTRRHFALVTS